MKSALILVGHIRTLTDNWVYFDKIIKKYNSDVYIETWDKFGYWKEAVDYKKFSSKNDKGFDDNSDLISKEQIQSLTNCKYINVDVYDEYDNLFTTLSEQYEHNKIFYLRPKNILTQWYKRKKIINYVSSLDIPYDHIILTRPDLRILNDDLDTPKNVLNVSRNYSSNGYGDVLFTGNMELIFKLGELYDNIDKCPYQFDGHNILKWWLSNIPHRLIKYDALLYNTPNGYCKP